MTKAISPITPEQLAKVDLALTGLRSSAALLREAGATRSLTKVQAAIKSTEGARRHAYHRFNRSHHGEERLG